MNIVTLLQAFVDELFEARDCFYDSPDKLAQFEQMVADASHKTAAGFIGEVFSEMDDQLMDNLRRKERFIIQRKRERNLISTVGDIHYERTYCRDRETGEYRCPLDEII
ncbi:MAG: UPF0236 family protein, partial [Lachnospiraceae bacterium]|nr:UPF0236 family protein [Lachnospiraceae bacterium]